MPEGLRAHLAMFGSARFAVINNGANASRGGEGTGKVSGLRHWYEMIIGTCQD